jgi:hypothetical protein
VIAVRKEIFDPLDDIGDGILNVEEVISPPPPPPLSSDQTDRTPPEYKIPSRHHSESSSFTRK